MTNDEAIKYLQQIYPNCGHCWLDEQRIEAIEMAIQALQEEPVSIWHNTSEKPERDDLLIETNDGRIIHRQSINNYGMVKRWAYTSDLLNLSNVERTGKDWKEEPVSEDLGGYINKLSKQFPEVSFAKLSRIAVRVSRWQQNQDVKNKLPKVTDRTELDEYAYQCAYDMSNDWMIENPTWDDVEVACKLGAKWQKQQDQSTIELAEDHAMLAGMEKMKEQMMEKAVDVTVHIDAGGYPYIPQIELYDYDKDIPLAKEGDKYKVVLIKEE